MANVRVVPISRIVPAVEDKDPRDVARLVELIRQSGRFEPIEVMEYPGDDSLYIEDGNTRYAAARLLGMTEVPVQDVETKMGSKTAWKEIEYGGGPMSLLGGILEDDGDLEAWAENEDVNDRPAYMEMFRGMKVGVIDQMNVERKLQGKGHGREILERFTDEAKAAGCAAILLKAGIYETQRKGFDLVKWYQGAGFRTIGKAEELPLMVKWLQAPTKKKRVKSSEAPSKNACVMIVLPDELAWKVQELARKVIAEEDLAGDGYENESHITIKYGVEENLDGLIAVAKSQPPFEISLGKTHIFPPSKSSDQAAVVVIEIHAPELSKLHEQVGEAIGNRKDDFEYKSHATLAYVKPEVAEKYDALDFLEGVKFEATEITLSKKDHVHNSVPFGQPEPKTAGKQSTHSLVLTADVEGFPPMVLVRYPQKGMRWRTVLKIVKQIATAVAGSRVPWRSIDIFQSPWKTKEEQDAAWSQTVGKPQYDILEDGRFIPSGQEPPTVTAGAERIQGKRRSSDIKCLCGNEPMFDGFYTCNEEGDEVEPTEQDWDGRRIRCHRCGRIIDQNTLEVLPPMTGDLFSGITPIEASKTAAIEYITQDLNREYRCICGNTPYDQGFHTVDENGEDKDDYSGEDWGTNGRVFWLCDKCGRIINGRNLEVVGYAPYGLFGQPMKMSSASQWDRVKEFKNGKMLFYKGTVTIQVKPDKGDYSVEVWLYDKEGHFQDGTPGHAHVTHYPKKFEGYEPDVSRIGYTLPTADHAVVIPEAVWKDPKYPMHDVPFTREQKEEAAGKELAHYLSQKTSSHNSTPLSDTEYPEFAMNDAGQETNAYADMPEKVQGDEKVPTLEELAPQMFTAAAKIRAFHGTDSEEPPNHDAIYFAQYPEDARDYGKNVFPAILTPNKVLKPNVPYQVMFGLLQPMLLENKGLDVKDFVGKNGVHYTYLGDYPEVLQNMRNAGYDAVMVDEPMSVDQHSILVLNPAIIQWQKQIKVGSAKLPTLEEAFRWGTKHDFWTASSASLGEVVWDDAWDNLPEHEQANQARSRIEYMWNTDVLPVFKVHKFPMTLYRAVAVEDIQEVDPKNPHHVYDWAPKGIGISWAYSESSEYIQEMVQSAPQVEHKVVVLRGTVTANAVDWPRTGWVNLNLPEEEEIALKVGAAVKITGWKYAGETEWKQPPRKLRTVTANSPEGDNMPEHYQPPVGMYKVLKSDPFAEEMGTLEKAASVTPKVVYHGSSPENRQSILQHGLLASKSDAAQLGGHGVLFFDDKLDTQKGIDEWEVNVEGLDLEPDDTTDISNNPDWEGHTWWAYYGDIPPERLKLIHEGGKIAKLGQAYLLHFDSPAGAHKLGWGKDAQPLIQRHFAANQQRNIAFTVAHMWDNVSQAEFNARQARGGLAQDCPICRQQKKDQK